MSTTHTPGPWAVAQSAYGPVIDSPEGVPVAKLHHANTGPHQCDASYDTWPYMANARLIAAAPDMLAALEHADRELYELLASRKLDSTDAPFHAVRMVRDQVRAAIAKAKGTT